jgi:hypothetical protein
MAAGSGCPAPAASKLPLPPPAQVLDALRAPGAGALGSAAQARLAAALRATPLLAALRPRAAYLARLLKLVVDALEAEARAGGGGGLDNDLAELHAEVLLAPPGRARGSEVVVGCSPPPPPPPGRPRARSRPRRLGLTGPNNTPSQHSARQAADARWAYKTWYYSAAPSAAELGGLEARHAARAAAFLRREAEAEEGGGGEEAGSSGGGGDGGGSPSDGGAAAGGAAHAGLLTLHVSDNMLDGNTGGWIFLGGGEGLVGGGPAAGAGRPERLPRCPPLLYPSHVPTAAPA